MGALLLIGMGLVAVASLYAAFVYAFYRHDSEVDDPDDMWVW